MLLAARWSAARRDGCAHPRIGDSSAPASSQPAVAGRDAADSKAADFRTRFDLLLGEHVIAVAKQAVAPRAGPDEYTGYLRLLDCQRQTTSTDACALGPRRHGGCAVRAGVEQAERLPGQLHDRVWSRTTQAKRPMRDAGLTRHVRAAVRAACSGEAAPMPADQSTQLVAEHVVEIQGDDRRRSRRRPIRRSTRTFAQRLRARLAHRAMRSRRQSSDSSPTSSRAIRDEPRGRLARLDEQPASESMRTSRR